MTRTTGRLICSLATAALLLTIWHAPVGAQPQGPFRGKGTMHGGSAGLMLGVPLRSLNLTPDQWTQVRSILSTYRDANRPIMQQLRQAQSELADKLLASPSGDVSAQLATINSLRTQLLQNSATTTAQVLGVLTPDQRTTAAQTRATLKNLRTQMHQLLAPAGTQPSE